MPANNEGYDLDKYDLGAYKDYFKNEKTGKEPAENKKGGVGNKLILLLLFIIMLLIVGIAYFVWKGSGSSVVITVNEKKPNSSIQSKRTSAGSSDNLFEDKSESNMNKVVSEVQSAASASNSKEKMSQEEIAAIVQMVLKTMEQKKEKTSDSAKIAGNKHNDTDKGSAEKKNSLAENTGTESTTDTGTTDNSDSSAIAATESDDQIQDSKLMESLSGTEVDTLAPISDDNYTTSGSGKKKKASTKVAVNTYNKVEVGSKTISEDDDLGKLSSEISSLIESDDEAAAETATDTQTDSNKSTIAIAKAMSSASRDTNKSSLSANTKTSSVKVSKTKKKAEKKSSAVESGYTQSIKKEVKTRTKEMRYIVVKKGDTLSGIARRAYGDAAEYKKIFKANPDILRRADMINIGQKLRIP